MEQTNKYYIGEPYWISPYNIKIDEKIARFNPAKPDNEYESLKMQIEDGKQEDPAYMRDGILGDGRHRMRIAQELGRKLLVQDIDPGIPDEKYIVLCNKNTFGARNDSPAQVAIKAYALVKEYKYTDAKAVKLAALKDPRAIGYVRYITDTRHAKVLENLKAGGKAEIKDLQGNVVYIGVALKTLKEKIARLEEEEMLVIDDSTKSTPISIDYNDYLNTETAKDVFWSHVGKNEMVTSDTKILFCELLNLKYKLKDKE